jgi:drug/metabolite transporter (DMT)-like permease
MTLNKLVNPAIPTSVKILIRACFGLFFFSPLILKEGMLVFRSNNLRLQIIRILYMSVAMGGTYFTYANLPFTVAVSIGFTGPVFTAVLSYFILKDRLSFSQWLAIIAGYIGVLMMTNPQGEINNAIYIAILANITTGLSLIYAKKLTSIDSRSTIVILGNVGVIIVASIWTLCYWMFYYYVSDTMLWYWPTLQDVGLLMGMGFLGAFSQISYVTALKHASPSFLSPFEYSRLVIAVPIGLTLGEAFPHYQEIIGMCIIILSTLYMSWRGSRDE